MVPDENKKAMRNGRAAAARAPGAATTASRKIKIVKILSLRGVVAMTALYHGATLAGKAEPDWNATVKDRSSTFLKVRKTNLQKKY